ncbi:MAG: SpoIIE family protein phosphatase [Actinomycetota bacterium]|nr:SpoIIE family protein phosphatase [Actinomycetota bacterium]
MREAPTRIEQIVEAARGLSREVLESALDFLPMAVLLIEPGTARVTFANRAADVFAGGEFPKGLDADRYHELYYCTDAHGERIPDERMPGVRAARGERLDGYQMDWWLPHGTRSLMIWGDTLRDPEGEDVTVLVFEDVTDLRATERAKDESLALLDTLFSSAPVGLAFLDASLRYVRINDALAEMNGVPADDHVGRSLSEVLPEMDPDVRAHPRRVLETGEPVLDIELTGRTPAQPGEQRHWRAGYYPVRHRTGEILGVGCVVVEETDRVRLLEAERGARERAELAEQRASFLARAGEMLTASLDYEETLRRVARAAVPERADWCVVDMLTPGGELRRLAAAHTDPDKERWAAEVERRWPARPEDDAGVFHVLRTGEPELYESIPEELVAASAQDEEHLRVILELGLSSAMIVPLIVRGEPVGAVTFILSESGRHYGREDLTLAIELARRASAAIENARLYGERSHIAQTLQRSLLPPRLPEIEGFELGARYRAAGEGYDVGGDFYDAFQTPGGQWAMVVGDVCGKGPGAAALTSLARYTIRAAALVQDSPAGVLRMASEAIQRERTTGHFVSAIHVWVHPQSCRVTLACAGHPAALIVRTDGAVEETKPAGTLLGISLRGAYEDRTIQLRSGDAIVLYTDGVLDAGAPQHVLEPERLAEVVGSAAGGSASELARVVEEEALSVGGGVPRDDMAILVLRCA